MYIQLGQRPAYSPGAGGGGTGLLGTLRDELGPRRLEERLGELLPARAELLPALAARLRLEPEQLSGWTLGRETLQALVADLVSGLARRRATVWVVEDLHLADAEERALLIAIARAATGAPLLLLVTSRSPLGRDLSEALPQLAAVCLELGRLGGTEVEALLSARLDDRARAARLAPELLRRTGGNPYFVAEMARELIAGGVVGRELPLPASLSLLLRGRLEGLDRSDRELLDVAAVEGAAFDPDLAARVVGRRPLDVLQALAALERRGGLVRATGIGFEFEHHLLQELVHDELPPLLRRELHAALFRACRERQRHGGGPDRTPGGDGAVFLANHGLRGGDGDAFSLLPAALDHLERQDRHEALLALIALAVESAALPTTALETELRLRGAGCLERIGRRAEALAEVGLALSAARATFDGPRTTRALILLAGLRRETGDLDGALAAGEEALARAEAGSDPAAIADAARSLGMRALYRNELDRAETLFQRSIAAARAAADPRLEGASHGSLGIVLHRAGRYADAAARYEEQLALCRRSGDRRGEITALGNLSNSLQELGEFDRSCAVICEVIALCEKSGYRPGETIAWTNLGHFRSRMGAFVEARSALDRAIALALEVGDRRIEATALVHLGSLHHLTGAYVIACAPLDRALQLARELGAIAVQISAETSLSSVALALGELDAARQHSDAALAILTAHGRTDLHVDTFLQAAEVAFARDEIGRGNELLEQVESAAALESSHSRARVALARGRALVDGGCRAEAQPYLAYAERVAANTALADLGCLPSAWLSRIGARDPGTVVVHRGLAAHLEIETHVVLAEAGASEHLLRARAQLDELAGPLGGEMRERLLRFSPAGRRLASAELRASGGPRSGAVRR